MRDPVDATDLLAHLVSPIPQACWSTRLVSASTLIPRLVSFRLETRVNELAQEMWWFLLPNAGTKRSRDHRTSRTSVSVILSP
ncbi:hypothetical protein MPLB_2410016 [Mesorhizobium sp. ORS 3324]|nr:hypothetical protein MPLB_2410016 [Mesorhizobium sp. ORS 3324]